LHENSEFLCEKREFLRRWCERALPAGVGGAVEVAGFLRETADDRSDCPHNKGRGRSYVGKHSLLRRLGFSQTFKPPLKRSVQKRIVKKPNASNRSLIFGN